MEATAPDRSVEATLTMTKDIVSRVLYLGPDDDISMRCAILYLMPQDTPVLKGQA